VAPVFPEALPSDHPGGVVQLEAVVAASGRIDEARVRQSFDREHGVNAAALAAVTKWEFTPGLSVGTRLDGTALPVPAGAPTSVVVLLQVEFSRSNGKPSAAVPPVVMFPAAVAAPPEAFEGVPTYGTPGIRFPTAMRMVSVNYSDAAIRAKVQGEVSVQVIVQADGTVGAVRVSKSLDTKYGLDAEAMAAAERWLFNPAMRDGQPIPVCVNLEFSYRLH
jgi:TonB family protein